MSSQKDLKKSVRDLRRQLTTTTTSLPWEQSKAQRWKTTATTQRRTATKFRTQIDKLQKKLDQAVVTPEPTPQPGNGVIGHPAESRPAQAGTVPDPSWTAVQLRTETRARGLTGLSNKPKADLLAALR